MKEYRQYFKDLSFIKKVLKFIPFIFINLLYILLYPIIWVVVTIIMEILYD